MSSRDPFPQSGHSRRPLDSTGQEKPALRSAGAQLVKDLISSLVRYRPAKKPICLFASRRSGSTLLMQVISANRGVMFSDQPFGLYSISSANVNRLPVFAYSQIACPDHDEEAILRRYFQALVSGEIRVNTPWKIWSRDFHFSNDRICLKITDAKAMIDWFAAQFDVDIVVLTRHPIAQALSVADKRWLMTGKGLLRNAKFCEQWLTDDLVAECWDLYRHGSELQWRIVDWALENRVPLALLPDRPDWLYVSYEDLTVHTDAVIEYLAAGLRLEDRSLMARQIGRPSRSTKGVSSPERQQMIQDGNRERLVDSWRNRVSLDECLACFQLLERFGINLYQPDSSFPSHRLIGRAGFSGRRQTDRVGQAEKDTCK